MIDEKQVALAAVAGAHGVEGEIRLKLFADSVDSLRRHRQVRVGERLLTLAAVRGGAQPIARLAEIADRSAAEALRGQLLTVPRSALPPLDEGEYYHADLLGLPCVDRESGEPIGSAVMVENFGAGDLVEIERPDGARFLVPIAVAVEIRPDRLIVDPAFII